MFEQYMNQIEQYSVPITAVLATGAGLGAIGVGIYEAATGKHADGTRDITIGLMALGIGVDHAREWRQQEPSHQSIDEKVNE
jgi:fatty acid-binding protein DegV